MRRMSTEHYVLLAGFLAVVGLQLATMGDSWNHVLTPSFLGGFLGQVAILLRAIFTEKPSVY